MLVSYEFYTGTYGGTAVSETEFPRYEKLAELFLNRVSFGHIVKNGDDVYGQLIGKAFSPFTEAELEALQYGVCNCLEAAFKIDEAEKQALSGNSSSGNVKSRTSGGESISYEARKTTYDEAISDNSKKNDLLKNALLVYAYPEVFRVNPYYAGRW